MDVRDDTWRKSSYSGNNGGQCVEVGAALHAVAVRDSKDPQGPALAFGPQVWAAFTSRVQGDMSKAAV
jgi:hypothetical protein